MSKLKYDIMRCSRLGGNIRIVAQEDPDGIMITVNNDEYRPPKEEQFVTTPEDFIEILTELLEATKAVFHKGV